MNGPGNNTTVSPNCIIQGDGRKFLGKLLTPFWVTNIIRITQAGSHLANEPNFATKMSYSLYMSDCFGDISTREVCTVTRKLDLDPTWKEHTRTLKTVKDTDTVTLTLYCKFGVCSLDMTLFERFSWYLWHKMAFKMPHEFPTTFLES